MAHGTSRRPWLRSAQVRKLTGLSRRQVARIFPEMAAWGAKRVDGCHWALPDTREARRALTAYKRTPLKNFKHPMKSWDLREFRTASAALLKFRRAIRWCHWIRDGSNPYALQIYQEVRVMLREFSKLVDGA